MTQWDSLNVILCNTQLNKLRSGTKNVTRVSLSFLSNVIFHINYY